MKDLTVADVEIIATGMRINRLERELRENKEAYSNVELSEGGRKIRQDQLNAMRKRYKRLVRQNNKFDEYGYFIEKESERKREEELMRAYDEGERELNDMGLESYDLID